MMTFLRIERRDAPGAGRSRTGRPTKSIFLRIERWDAPGAGRSSSAGEGGA
jgi:hypothetical protein